jgi:hypothetical protein
MPNLVELNYQRTGRSTNTGELGIGRRNGFGGTSAGLQARAYTARGNMECAGLSCRYSDSLRVTALLKDARPSRKVEQPSRLFEQAGRMLYVDNEKLK